MQQIHSNIKHLKSEQFSTWPGCEVGEAILNRKLFLDFNQMAVLYFVSHRDIGYNSIYTTAGRDAGLQGAPVSFQQPD